MSEFNEKYKVYESKKKKSNRSGITLLIIGLIIFAGLFVFNIYNKNKKKEDEAIIFEYNIKQIKEKEQQDSIKYVQQIRREDSLKQALKQVQHKISEIKNASGINQTVRRKIDSLQVRVNTIQSIAQDTIVVRYYRREADGNRVENAIKSIGSPNFYLNYRNVPNDNGLKQVNTLYYGKNVNKNYINLLHKRLLKYKVDIKDLKPFS